MIGVHGSDRTKVFISGIDLEDFPQALKGCKVIVTFNRARFDLPFIEQHLPSVNFDQLHIDLLYPLCRPSLTGGLKRIETELGLSRSDETTGLSGFDAVRLFLFLSHFYPMCGMIVRDLQVSCMYTCFFGNYF